MCEGPEKCISLGQVITMIILCGLKRLPLKFLHSNTNNNNFIKVKGEDLSGAGRAVPHDVIS